MAEQETPEWPDGNHRMAFIEKELSHLMDIMGEIIFHWPNRVGRYGTAPLQFVCQSEQLCYISAP